MNIKSGQSQKIYKTVEPILDITLSPNGETIAFAQQIDLYHSSMWLLHVDDGKTEEITSGKFYDTSPYFKTDSELFYISDQNDDTSRIYRINLTDFQIDSIPNTQDAIRIVDIEDNRLLFTQGLYFYPSLNLLDLDSHKNIELFDPQNFEKIWSPELTETGMQYFQGKFENMSQHELEF